MTSGDVPPTRSLPASKMDSPTPPASVSLTGETSRQHPLAGGLQMGGAPDALLEQQP